MLTRCPACATIFRVTPEQLKVRHGTVRCGACQEIFNGIDQLVDDVASLPSRPIAEKPATLAEPAADASATRPQPSPPPADATPETAAPFAPEDVPQVAEQFTGTSTVLDFNLDDPDLGGSPDPDAAVPPNLTFAAPEESSPAEEPSIMIGDMPPDTMVAPGESLAEESLPVTEPPKEIVAATAATPPVATPRSWPWAVGIATAAFLLCAQTVVHYRVELATLSPDTRPALEALCDMVGCSVGLPAKVDMMAIEASDLAPNPDQKGRLTLAATLRNRAPFAQEHPLLELTLTDNTNAAVARRILTPADYLPKDADPARGVGANQDLVISVALEATAPGATGYRLYLFYP